MEVLPASAGTGIVFHRTDSQLSEPVLAHAYNISSTALSTTIGHGVSAVSTIEHIMAALAGLEVSNAIIQLDGPEVPIMDGSSAPFVRKILAAGIKELSAIQKVYRVKRPFELRQGDQFIRIEPSASPSIRCTIDFPFKVIGKQTLEYSPSAKDFLKISDARTFCHMRDVSSMKEKGLALGGSLENALVISDEGLVNDGGLRSKHEFVEHKLLDLIGDLALLGAPLQGDILVNKPGHSLHAKFTKALLDRESFYLEVLNEEQQTGSYNETRTAVPFSPALVSIG